jgi:hypothetical protein
LFTSRSLINLISLEQVHSSSFLCPIHLINFRLTSTVRCPMARLLQFLPMSTILMGHLKGLDKMFIPTILISHRSSSSRMRHRK